MILIVVWNFIGFSRASSHAVLRRKAEDYSFHHFFPNFFSQFFYILFLYTFKIAVKCLKWEKVRRKNWE